MSKRGIDSILCEAIFAFAVRKADIRPPIAIADI